MYLGNIKLIGDVETLCSGSNLIHQSSVSIFKTRKILSHITDTVQTDKSFCYVIFCVTVTQITYTITDHLRSRFASVSSDLTKLSLQICLSKMAEAAKNQLPSGYDEDFVNVVEEDFQCSICHLPLKEPVQTRCGHRFCKECLEEHLRRCVVGNITRMKFLTVHHVRPCFRKWRKHTNRIESHES